MNPLPLRASNGCKSGFWAMIIDPFGAGLPRLAGGARGRGGAGTAGHHGSLNRLPPRCD